MKILSVTIERAFALCALAAVAASIPARSPGRKPGYLHAIADLQHARKWLTVAGENNVSNREAEAITKIDRALNEINRAAADAGKDTDDRYPTDASIKHRGRLHKSLTLLEAAKTDLNFSEPDKASAGWRSKASKHVAEAINADKEAIKDVKNDS